ncbi:TetR/AcrR family transcriptional regulator [Cytobacillus solani]|uniref:Transcriptional regulator n=1 Tax=Cytobacillus solani TaxID=1637975 RepID=A0A0Q3QPW4_9BACI|nr:TetR/AcrR family transcriptional regulator [Cytobacillus solani]KOP82719.1 transcriptional regulator [Bacillus sp. FJAT-21945]KQL19734.1 transcriptional regulator [Cytobacillus solani]USK52965.1 TetR/AcrR family transcriptional regulator [Cytobacillus solani]
MPRTVEENERIRHLSKEKILETAMGLFIKKGYHTTSISEVASHAGVSKGLLYNYFKGKEELLAYMISSRVTGVSEVMSNAIRFERPEDQLKYIIEHALDHVYENPAEFRFYLNLQTQPEEDELLNKYSKVLIEENANQFEIQCKIFEKLGIEEPRKRSLYFSSTLHGVMLMIISYPKNFPLNEIKKQIVREFC